MGWVGLIWLTLWCTVIEGMPSTETSQTVKAEEPRKVALRIPTILAKKDWYFDDIDFVYTWYNANHKGTQDQRLRTLHEVEGDPDLAPDAWFQGRYFDNGELRYALRSVALNAPWVHRIHIVIGDEQPIPSFLKEHNPKIQIVRHSQIFPENSKLPTYNSLAIEACLHRIPGLTNLFVYFNDDMFIGERIGQETFFSTYDYKPRVWIDYGNTFCGGASPDDDGHTAAQKNTQKLLRYHAPRQPMFDGKLVETCASLHHQGKALSKDMMGKAEDVEWKAFYNVRQKQFRARSSFSPVTFASILCVHRGDCENAVIPRSYFGNMNLEANPDEVFRHIKQEGFTFICINNSVETVKEEVERGM